MRDDKQYHHVLEEMRTRFGAIVEMLRSLPDFHLIALKPQQGLYIAGFGKAFNVDSETGDLQTISA